MIKSTEICPKCSRIAGYNSYFNKHCCTNKECGFHELIVHKNEDWIDFIDAKIILDDFRTTEFQIIVKLNEIAKILNKITNPDVNDNNIIR